MQNDQYKKRLEEEKVFLERELSEVGRINPDNPDDWEPTAADLNIDTAEEEERATEVTAFEDRSAVEFTLEERLNKVKAALVRITNETYGRCGVCGNAIEPERLNADATAGTCKAHINQ